ncbi:MAG: PspA/IM30 family protein [Dehalococcoidia bacterium]
MLKRISAIFQAKANKALDHIEDPREMLDLSYEKQVSMLRDVKRGIVEVTAARKRLELQAVDLKEGLPRFEAQALQAMKSGREDLARVALERKAQTEAQIANFEGQVARLKTEQDQLIAAEARLSAKVDAFRTRKEVMKAEYTAAKATVRIGEAVTGLSEEMTDVGLAIQRAEDRTAQLKSKGAAIHELVESGVLDDQAGESTLDRELDALGRAASVEADLARLRAQVGAGRQSEEVNA